MNVSDLINGLFEILGMFFILPSIYRVVKDKQVRGVSWVMLAFFSSWGVWNLFFYPHNGLTISFIGGIFVCLANIVYLILLIYYK